MFARANAVLFLAIFVMVFSARAERPFSFATTPGQLPKTVVPHHYDIQLQPDLEHFTTHGLVTIDIEVLKSVQEITLNALDMNVTRATLLNNGETSLTPVQDPHKQIVRLKLSHRLPPGNYRLALEFEGKLGEQAQGFFYVKYPSPSGQKIMLGTQMEPSDARRMFPCWDEPVFRATFDLTVTLPEKFQAFSNLPIEHETPLTNGLKKIKFGRTPPMSSYLIVLVAGELEMISGEAEGVQIHVVTTEGKREQGRYALEATKKLLAYYNDYFGIKYPLPKLDQIAIPGGFDGAMENWGGIAYNESVLLYDPKTSSLQTQRDIFVTVAHEMSHQWFGNLVTTAWWDNLWLNEGFATWMETKATDHFNPTWQVQLSANADKSSVMGSDARPITHPIQDKVRNESEANDAFDSITYQKGGAFLRMLEAYLGPEVFRSGIQHYLTAHLYSNTTTADLWQALEKVSHQPIHSISAGWTEQPGLPVVIVNGKETISLKQERFTVQDPHPKPLRWKIPVTLFTDTNSAGATRLLLADKSTSLQLPICSDLIKANANDTGYYRVLYSASLFEKLKLNLKLLSAADRLNLLDDCWAMVEGKRLSATNYFGLIESLHDEKVYAIWSSVISIFNLIDNLEQQQPDRAAFQAYVRQRLQPQFQRLGWTRQPDEPITDSLLRSAIIESLGHFGDQSIIDEAKKRFADFVANPESLGADLRSAVLKIAGRYSDQTIYDQIHRLAKHATGTEERQLYYSALSGALDPKLAQQTLALSLTDESVPQETTALVIQVASNGEHPDLAWQFADQHLKELLPRVDDFARNEYIPSIFNSFSDVTRAKELENDISKKVSADAFAKAQITADEIRFKAALKERSLPVIDQWIKNQNHEN